MFLTTGSGTELVVNSRLYCSKVKNLVARFGVSARIGGKIPLTKKVKTSFVLKSYVHRFHSNVQHRVIPIPG